MKMLVTLILCACSSVTFADALPELDCVIEPSQIVDIGSASAGVLEEVRFDRGDSVKKNMVIARLESGTEKAATELARVRSSFNTGIQLRQTSADFFTRNQERSQSLSKQSAISKQQLDQLDTEAHVAELQVRQEEENKQLAALEYRRAQHALNRRSIKSPINGVIMERFKTEGEYVEDTAIMRVAQLDPLHVETIVPVSYMGQIEPGMQAAVSPEVPGQKAQYATVTRVDRVADAASGTFGVRLELDNPNGDIVTGVRCALKFNSSNSAVAKNSASTQKHQQSISQATAQVKLRVAQPVAKTSAVGNQSSVPSQFANDSTFPAMKNQCFELGPIKTRSAATDMAVLLEQQGGDTQLREVPGAHPGQYFVLTEKTTDRVDANRLLAEIKSKGIKDMHLLLRGPNRHKISLGLYTNKNTAQSRVNELNEMGLAVHVAPRSTSTIWLEYTSAQLASVTSVRQVLSPSSLDSVRTVPCATIHAANGL